MSKISLADFVYSLKSSNELIEIETSVSPILEISEITDRLSKTNGKALFFKSTGTEFPLLINAFGSEKRMLMALGINSFEELKKEIESYFELVSSPPKGLKEIFKALKKLRDLTTIFPKKTNSKAECYKNTFSEVDLFKLPVLKCWPFDGGQFITLPMVHTIDPETSAVNMGMYRMQIFDKNTCGLHWHKHKGGALHFEKYKEKGLRMPIVVTLGGNPAYTYCATAPLPEMISEYALAAYLNKKRIKMTKASNCDIFIPADVDFVIEGYVDTTDDLVVEGPFGDHTGYYSLPGLYPKMHVTRISYKDNAIYPATIVGIPPMEDAFLGLATEQIFLPLIKKIVVPELEDMSLPVEGGFHNLAIASIRNRYAGQAVKTMNAMWGAGQLMFVKNIIIVDHDVNIRDAKQVFNAIFSNATFPDNFHFMFGPLDVLDHANSKPIYGKKMGIDACRKSDVQKKNVENFDAELLKQIIDKFKFINKFDLGFEGSNYEFAIVYIDKFKVENTNIYNDLLVEVSSSDLKYLIFIDKNAADFSSADILWLFLANFDPDRDIYIYKNDEKILVGFDGTQKIRNIDNVSFTRPNATIMDESTIQIVDNKWESYGIGEFIESPSCKYKKITLGEGYLYDK